MMKTINHGAALRAMRPIKEYVCKQCGKDFKSSDTRATYCTDTCRSNARHKRNRMALPCA